jgi:hypothetical protein
MGRQYKVVLKYFVRDWTGFIWFKIWAGDSHLCTLYLTYGYLWNRSSDLTEQHLVSQEGLYLIKLLLLADVLAVFFCCVEDSGFRNKHPVPLNYTLAPTFWYCVFTGIIRIQDSQTLVSILVYDMLIIVL